MEISNILRITEHTLLVKYLEVPLTFDYIHAAHCLPLISKITCKLKGWDNQLLTTAERAKLIHSTITLIVMYWLLIYHLPLSVLKKVDQMCAEFF